MMTTKIYFDTKLEALEEASRIRSELRQMGFIAKIVQAYNGKYRLKKIPIRMAMRISGVGLSRLGSLRRQRLIKKSESNLSQRVSL